MSIPIFIPVLMVLVLWAVTVWKSGQEPTKNQERTNHHSKPRWYNYLRKRPEETPDQRRDRHEQNHRTHEKFYWIVICLLTAGAVGGAVWGVVKADQALTETRSQAQAAQAQLNIMRAENRPWIVERINAITKLTIDKTGHPSATVVFEFSNYGHAPAYSVFPLAALFANGRDEKTFTGKNEIDRTCDASLITTSTGETVFPGQPPIPLSIEALPTTYDRLSKADGNDENMLLIMAGCVIYYTHDPIKMHRTYFAYFIEEKNSKGQVDMVSAKPHVSVTENVFFVKAPDVSIDD